MRPPNPSMKFASSISQDEPYRILLAVVKFENELNDFEYKMLSVKKYICQSCFSSYGHKSHQHLPLSIALLCQDMLTVY